jgi:hypothetical protein
MLSRFLSATEQYEKSFKYLRMLRIIYKTELLISTIQYLKSCEIVGFRRGWTEIFRPLG